MQKVEIKDERKEVPGVFMDLIITLERMQTDVYDEWRETQEGKMSEDLIKQLRDQLYKMNEDYYLKNER